MRPLLTILLLNMILPGTNEADESGLKLDFRPIAEVGKFAEESAGPNGEPAITVASRTEPRKLTLSICDHPQISGHQYRVRGWVKYTDVVGTGYLELLNDFGVKGTFFTRTLVEHDGTLAMYPGLRKLQGSSDWREFELPFHAEPGMLPQRLTINLVLPGTGEVVVAQPILELQALPVELAATAARNTKETLTASDVNAARPAAEGRNPSVDKVAVAAQSPRPREWWSNRQAGLIGGALGIIGGIFGTIMGLMGGSVALISNSLRWRRVFSSLYLLMLGLSVIALMIGTLALMIEQPYHVFYPLLLTGFIGTLVLSLNYQTVHRRMADSELRKMTAIDMN